MLYFMDYFARNREAIARYLEPWRSPPTTPPDFSMKPILTPS
ncbi:hypothetical protein [Laspinema olomoucense]|nr:hypothetical protein [Laspinema sp. D3d]